MLVLGGEGTDVEECQCGGRGGVDVGVLGRAVH